MWGLVRRLKERPAFMVLAIPVVLFAAVLYDQWRSEALLPPFLQFVPPNAVAFAAADHLSGAVENGAPHAGLFWPVASEGAGDLEFAEHCAGLRGAADLERYGFDGSRGAAAFRSEPSATVLALPVADEGRAIDFLRSVSAPSSSMVLEAAPADKPVQWLRIENPEIAGVRLCGTASPVPIELGHGATIDVASASDGAGPGAGRSAEFFVVRESDEPALVDLQCVAVYADASEGACNCTLDGEPCGGPVPGALPTTVRVSVPGIPRPVVKIGEDDPSYYLEASPGIGLVAFMEATPEAEEDNLAPLVEALQVDRNIARFRNDDTYLRLLSDFATARRQGDTRVLASVGSYLRSVVGMTQIAASLLPTSVQLTMFAPFETGGARIVDFLSEPAPGPIAVRTNPLTGGSLALRDEHTADYLRYLSRYFPDLYRTLKDSLGTLSVFLDRLADTKFSKIDVDLYGEKDGVPGLVIQIDMDSGDVDRYFAAVAGEMQRRRDVRILEAAFSRAKGDGKAGNDSKIAELAAYLPADQSLLVTYQLTWDAAEPPDFRPKFGGGPADVAAEPVDVPVGAPYEKAVFLSPRVTDGDLDYRFGESEDGSIDEAGLLDGRYRMIGLAAGNKVVIVTNRDTLQQLLSSPEGAAVASDDTGAKLLIDADPDWLRTQLALYPDPELREAASTSLRDLAGYRRLLTLVRPDPRLDGFMATILLDYDD